MIIVTILTGVVLIAVGLVGYFATGAEHMTALIPAVLGALCLVCGLVGSKPSLRKHAMHAAAALALLGTLGTVMGRVKLIRWMAGGAVPEREAAVVAQGVTAVVWVLFLVMAIRSFIVARQNRSPRFEVGISERDNA